MARGHVPDLMAHHDRQLGISRGQVEQAAVNTDLAAGQRKRVHCLGFLEHDKFPFSTGQVATYGLGNPPPNSLYTGDVVDIVGDFLLGLGPRQKRLRPSASPRWEKSRSPNAACFWYRVASGQR